MTIVGSRTVAGRAVVTIDGQPLDPTRSQHVCNHSPDGFDWGYSGSGPAQLALAVLLAAGLSDDEAVRHHQTFKSTFIAALPRTFAFDIDVLKWAATENRRCDEDDPE